MLETIKRILAMAGYKRLWNETILTSERKRGDCNA